MRLIDGDYLYNKLVANKCPYDLVLQVVKDEPTVCDIEQMIIEITQIDNKNGWIPIDEVFDIILKYTKGNKE